MSAPLRSGLIALIGRPNVGKSTLLNRLVGSKISITSHRPQTTRYRTLGIHTTAQAQYVYVDTPGLHPAEGRRLNRYLNRAATGSLAGVDCVALMISADGWRAEDEYPLTLARRLSVPVILVINKIDRVKDRKRLLPLIEESAAKMRFAEIVPLCARTGEHVPELERALLPYLPEQPPIYPEDQLTDKDERFLAAELIREQVFRGFGQEVPYAAAVGIERLRRAKGILNIAATIWVEKEGQKAILIGKGGERLKTVGRNARLAMQKSFGEKVYLELWVKVRSGWSDSESALRTLGYRAED